MAKIRAVMTFVTAQAVMSMLTADHRNVNISSVIEMSDMTGMQGCIAEFIQHVADGVRSVKSGVMFDANGGSIETKSAAKCDPLHGEETWFNKEGVINALSMWPGCRPTRRRQDLSFPLDSRRQNMFAKRRCCQFKNGQSG